MKYCVLACAASWANGMHDGAAAVQLIGDNFIIVSGSERGCGNHQMHSVFRGGISLVASCKGEAQRRSLYATNFKALMFGVGNFGIYVERFCL